MRLGIIGTGRIAKRAVKEIAEVSGIEISAIYNPNTEHASEFADYVSDFFITRGDGECSYDNGKKPCCAADIHSFTEQIDAAYIASPHGTHYEYALQMLGAGKHVICEKPMCFSESQVKELFEAAGANRCVLMEAVKTEFCPGFRKIEEVVKSGTIGDVADVEAAFTRLTPQGCREYDDLQYGGSFTEFGTYCMLPVFRFLGTDFDAVKFMSIPAETGVDGYTKAVFSYKKDSYNKINAERDILGKTAAAKTGLTVKGEGQLLISGTKGYILVPSPWWLTKYFEVRYEDPAKIDRYEFEFSGDGLRYEFAEFVRRISENDHANNRKDEASARARAYELFLKNREKKYRVGYTQGVYDMFHIGHLHIINSAASMCDKLIVGVNSDRLVEDYKGKKTVIPQEDRAEIIRSLDCVDECIITDTLDKVKLYERLGFDAVFIGDDWRGNERWLQTEKDLKPFGVDVVYLPHTPNISSTILRVEIPRRIEE